MAKVQAVVFDIYKTLIDIKTDEESMDAYLFLSQWLSYHGIHLEAHELQGKYRDLCHKEMVKNFDSYPDIEIGKVFAKILLAGQLPSREVASKARELALLFRMATTRHIALYPGVIPMLESLQGKVPLGIVSNAQSLFTVPELTRFGLQHYFDVIAFSSDAGVSKPNPRIFHGLLETLGVPGGAAVYIGDNLFTDINGANKVGMKTVWINHDRSTSCASNELAQPDWVVEGDYHALTELLLSML